MTLYARRLIVSRAKRALQAEGADMSKVGGGGLLLAGVFLIFLGFLIQSDILSRLLDLLGIIIIIGGAILGVIGLIQVFTGGGKRSSSDF